jgi:hypothetical protein
MIWESFRHYVTAEASMAPIPLVEAQLRRAAVDLCRRTHAWVGETSPIVAEAGQARHELTPVDSQARVFEPYRLWWNDQHLKFIPHAQMRRYGTHWPSMVGDVEAYTMIDEGAVTLFKSPASAGQLKGLGALQPSMTSTGVPDWLGEKFFDMIVAGAKARLLGMAETSWFNAEASMKYAAIFEGNSMSVAIRRSSAMSRGAESAPSQAEPT